MEDIFEKKLLFLLPFHIFVFEKDFSEYNNNKEALTRLQAEYREFMARLHTAVTEGELSVYYRRTIIDMSKRVLAGIAKNYDNVREGVDQIMGGKVLEHEGKTIYSAGWRDGEAYGEAQGEARGEARGEIKGEIKGSIKIYRDEMSLSPSDIIKKIVDRYSLDENVARQYVKETLQS